jgi:hypothetical protein
MVIGSVHYEDAPNDELFEAASQIGIELMAKGHTIFIGTDKHHTVDYHIFKGAKEESGKITGIEIHRPDDGTVPFAAEFQIPENEIFIKYYPYQDWQVVHMETLKNADALLIVGGSERTVIIGTAGNMLSKPVIPIGSFGGGGKAVWSYASSKREQFYQGGINDTDIDKLVGPWRGQTSAKHIVESLEKVHEAIEKSKATLARLSTPPMILLSVLMLMIAGMGVWVFLLAKGRNLAIGQLNMSGIGLLFLVVCFAGIWGSAMKSVLDFRNGHKLTSQHIIVDIVSGVGAGVISAILYLVLELAVTGRVNNPQETDDYVRVSLLVSLVAIFAAMYIDSALARFESVRETVLLGEFGNKREK